MVDGTNEGNYVLTPFEDSVIRALARALEEASVDGELIETLSTTFSAEKLPSPDSLLQTIKDHTGETSA